MNVSVIMAAYNSEQYIRNAIESILRQTFTDFEFLIINDGSSDKTLKIIKSYNDIRIKLIDNNKNLGLTKSLNIGMALAKGQYIARMDADDVSMPERLQKQVCFLDNHEDVGVVGSNMLYFGDRDAKTNFPLDHDAIKLHLLFYTALAHPSIMLRRDVLEKNGIKYNDQYRFSQDYYLYCCLYNITKFANLGDFLLRYRIHHSQISTAKNREQSGLAQKIRNQIIAKLICRQPSPTEIESHNLLWRPAPCRLRLFPILKNWAELLIEKNMERQIICPKVCADFIANRYWQVFRETFRIHNRTEWKYYIDFLYRENDYATLAQKFLSLYMSRIKNTLFDSRWLYY